MSTRKSSKAARIRSGSTPRRARPATPPEPRGVVIGAGTPLRFLPKPIRTPERPFLALAVAWLTAFPLSIAFAALAALVFPHAEEPQFQAGGAIAFFALVIFSPVVETLIMGAVLLALLRLVSPAAAILASAIGWGIAHSTVAPVWGLAIWWPFLIFSTLFVTWRSRSLALAFALPMCAHALQNLLPTLLIIVGRPA